MMITASQAIVGQTYNTSSGIRVEVINKTEETVFVRSLETDHGITLPSSYQLFTKDEVTLQENIMASDTAPTQELTKPRKLKKSNIVDEGLQNNLSVDEIVKNVLAAFPETLEKSVRNLVSVRRSKLKKTTTV